MLTPAAVPCCAPPAFSASSSSRSAASSTLQVEILVAEGLAVPEYRVGDQAKSIVCTNSMRPYVTVTCRGPDQQVDQAQCARTRAPAASAAPGGCTRFDECLHLPVAGGATGALIRSLEVVIRVFDERGIQSLMRGDPMIGQATISLGEELLGVPDMRTVWLTRALGRPPGSRTKHGTLTLRVGVLPPADALRVLSSCPSCSLAKAAGALAQVLVQPKGVDFLMESRPSGVTLPLSADESSLRQMLQTWIVQFDSCTEHLDNRAGDEVAAWQLARLSRAAQHIVSACAPTDLEGHEIQRLTKDWLVRLLRQCTGHDFGVGSASDCAQLQRLMEVGWVGGGAAHQRLKAYGIVIPSWAAESIEIAVLARLLRAEACKEVETFTGEPLVSHGRAARGLAAVFRHGHRSSGLHVFLYDYAGLRRWHAQHGTDPITREPLRSCDIFPLSARRHLCFNASSRWFADTCMLVAHGLRKFAKSQSRRCDMRLHR